MTLTLSMGAVIVVIERFDPLGDVAGLDVRHRGGCAPRGRTWALGVPDLVGTRRVRKKRTDQNEGQQGNSNSGCYVYDEWFVP